LDQAPLFTVDLEDWNHALHVTKGKHSSAPIVKDYLLPILKKNKVRAIFYVLGRFKKENESLVEAISDDGHIMGSHGHYHDHNETITPRISYYTHHYRSPYWDTTPMPWPPSGGFFFRALPYAWTRWATLKSGVFWIHPHDLDEEHPKLKNPLLNWKRHVGLKTARKKLERLLSEVKFGTPSHS